MQTQLQIDIRPIRADAITYRMCLHFVLFRLPARSYSKLSRSFCWRKLRHAIGIGLSNASTPRELNYTLPLLSLAAVDTPFCIMITTRLTDHA